MSSKNRRSIKNTIINCGECRMDVKENEDCMECDKCAITFHALCTNLNKRQFEYLINNDSEEYLCNKCNNNSDGSVKAELCEIKKQLNKLDQLSALQDTMTFMSKQFDEILRGVAENKKKIDNVQRENRVLKNEVKILKDSVKLLNDERVKKDCLISGVIVNDQSTAVNKLLAISSDIGVNLTESEVDTAYFLKQKDDKSKKRTMVVKFESKKSKEKLMSAKPKLKENENTKEIYVNDYLSKESLNVFKHAKALKRVGYQSVYTYNGKVFTKKSETSKPKLIKTEEEVDELLVDATTNKTARRRSNMQPTVLMQNVEDDDDGDEDRASFLSPA